MFTFTTSGISTILIKLYYELYIILKIGCINHKKWIRFSVCYCIQCYKSSKDQTPLLDISLLGCSVVYKEKQTKRKEHKLKITPLGGEAIVLGLQSKEQAEQWLKVRANGVWPIWMNNSISVRFVTHLFHLLQVIQEISPKNTAGSDVTDSPTLICTKVWQIEVYSLIDLCIKHSSCGRIFHKNSVCGRLSFKVLPFLAGWAEREILSGVWEWQQHRQSCREPGKQRWWEWTVSALLLDVGLLDYTGSDLKLFKLVVWTSTQNDG